MSKTALLWVGAAAAAFFAAGCSHVTFASAGNTDRVLVGAVDYTPPQAGDAGGPLNPGLPDDAEILVRVLDPNPQDAMMASAIAANPAAPPLFNGQNTAMSRTAANVGPQVLAEQTIHHPGPSPVPFRLEYTATDDQLRHGLPIEVRISYGGRIEYANANQYEVTLNDVADSHTVRVERMR